MERLVWLIIVAISNSCFLSYSPFVTFPATLMTTMGLGAWAWVPLVNMVVCAPWFVISARSAPSPPTASMLSSSPLNKRSVLTRVVGSACTSNCEVVTMVSPSPPRDAAWTGLIGGDGVVTMMGGVRIYFSLHSPKPPPPPPPSLSPYPICTSSEPTEQPAEPALRATIRKRDINPVIHVLTHTPSLLVEERLVFVDLASA
jgi:hypothetical protein